MVERIATAKSVADQADRILALVPAELREEHDLDGKREELIAGLKAGLVDPLKAVEHYINRIHWSGKNPTVGGSREWNENSALRRLTMQYGYMLMGLRTIAEGKHSCSKHGPVYAGGVKGKGSELFTPEVFAANALESAGKLNMERTLPDGTSSEADLNDPAVLDAELQRIVMATEAMADVELDSEEARQVLPYIKSLLKEKVLDSVDPAEYIDARIDSRYKVDVRKRTINIPKGSKDDAAFYLAHRVRTARAHLETLAEGTLPCIHEERYSSDGHSKLFTTQEFAASAIEFIESQVLREFKI